MKYRINKYLTLNGKTQKVTLPDSAYGEWIIYENNEPKYHVNIFNYKSKSDCLIFVILNENKSEFKLYFDHPFSPVNTLDKKFYEDFKESYYKKFKRDSFKDNIVKIVKSKTADEILKISERYTK